MCVKALSLSKQEDQLAPGIFLPSRKEDAENFPIADGCFGKQILPWWLRTTSQETPCSNSAGLSGRNVLCCYHIQ
jgi:hypothetical protein